MASTTLEESLSIAPKFLRLLRWGLGAMVVALAAAACGGGGGAVAPTATEPARSDQVAAFALTQQSVAARMGPLAAAPAPLNDGPGNMMTNGGFESGLIGWVSWGNASVAAGQASSGASALSVGPDSGGAGYDVGGVVPGSTYRLTAQARVGAAGDAVYVGVNFLDQSGLPATQNAVRVTSTGYTTVTFEAVAPPNAVKAVVYAWKNAGSGPAFVDDFAFAVADATAPGAASSNNLVTNGGFENGLANWVDWGNSASTTQAAAGSSAAQVGTGAGGFGQHVLGGVVPGNPYGVTAQAKVSAPGEIGYLGVMFTDAAGTALLVQNVVFRSTTYGAVHTDVIAPASATRAVVFVWKNAGSGFAMVDEVALVQAAPGSVTPPPPVVDTGPGSEAVVTSPVGAPVLQLPWGGAMSGSVFAFGSSVLRRYSPDGVPIGSAAIISAPRWNPTAAVPPYSEAAAMPRAGSRWPRRSWWRPGSPRRRSPRPLSRSPIRSRSRSAASRTTSATRLRYRIWPHSQAAGTWSHGRCSKPHPAARTTAASTHSGSMPTANQPGRPSRPPPTARASCTSSARRPAAMS